MASDEDHLAEEHAAFLRHQEMHTSLNKLSYLLTKLRIRDTSDRMLFNKNKHDFCNKWSRK